MNPMFFLAGSGIANSVAGKFKSVFKWILLLVIILIGSMFYWKYYFTYSEGYRAGVLQKFSKKGSFFKTYEGELILSSVSSTRDVALASDKFYFTLTNKKIVRELDTLQGDMVIVHYKQKNSSAFWRGDSEYLVDSVKVKR